MTMRLPTCPLCGTGGAETGRRSSLAAGKANRMAVRCPEYRGFLIEQLATAMTNRVNGIPRRESEG